MGVEHEALACSGVNLMASLCRSVDLSAAVGTTCADTSQDTVAY